MLSCLCYKVSLRMLSVPVWVMLMSKIIEPRAVVSQSECVFSLWPSSCGSAEMNSSLTKSPLSLEPSPLTVED